MSWKGHTDATTHPQTLQPTFLSNQRPPPLALEVRQEDTLYCRRSCSHFRGTLLVDTRMLESDHILMRWGKWGGGGLGEGGGWRGTERARTLEKGQWLLFLRSPPNAQ